MYRFYEFFAGGGMARAGLGDDWQCLFANDSDECKVRTYAENWGEEDIVGRDVAELSLEDLPGIPDLIWSSFPCQDLSLAGSGAGLAGSKSGAFWHFWSLVRQLNDDGRAPKIIVLENVMGAVTSHGGQDFTAICSALVDEGYRIGAFSIDASCFLPQSRRRLFITGARQDISVPRALSTDFPDPRLVSSSIVAAHARLSGKPADNWVWWHFPMAQGGNQKLNDFVGGIDDPGNWHTPKQTKKLISLMDANNLAKLEAAKAKKEEIVGTVYKRMRPGDGEGNVQRAEVRFDGVAGCLRVPIGGSSKQTLLFVRGNYIKSRLLSPREAARLMGLHDGFILPENERAAYHLTGDGVVVPVVSHLREHLFEPLINECRKASRENTERSPIKMGKAEQTPAPLAVDLEVS